MFDDTLRAQSAIDRFMNAAYDLVVEGESYRPRQKPSLDAANVTANAGAATPGHRARSGRKTRAR